MKDEILSILSDIIAIPSVALQSNLKLVEYIENYLLKLGGDIHLIHNYKKDKASLVCFFGPRDIEGGLILSGHMDTVPADVSKWSTDPFGLVEGVSTQGEAGYFGLGVCDMKTFIAQTLFCVKELDQKKIKKPLVLMFTYDEEVGCMGVRSALSFVKSLSRTIPSSAMIGEPTGLKVFTAHKGHTQLTISVRGKAGHSSRVDEGVNAIDWACRVISVINDYGLELREKVEFQNLFKEYPFRTLNVAKIEGGSAVNIIPEDCEIKVGYRTLPGDDSDTIYQELKHRIESEVLPALREKHPEADISFKLENEVMAMHTREGSEIEKNLREIVNDFDLHAAPFTTEGGIISHFGVDCIICGSGSIKNAHQSNEFIAQEDIFKGVDVIKAIIERMCF